MRQLGSVDGLELTGCDVALLSKDGELEEIGDEQEGSEIDAWLSTSPFRDLYRVRVTCEGYEEFVSDVFDVRGPSGSRIDLGTVRLTPIGHPGADSQ